VLLHLAGKSGIPYEVLHSLTTADAPETVWHVRDTFRRMELAGVKCTIDTHRTPDGGRVTFTEKFGKTVFLSREEAEKALRETEGKKDG
ncbi:MAG: hypothetical protein MSA04_07570, partial [Clostridiales bacterium]|nr:hypothetical protein [Clostridiales bacterium]